MTSVVQPTAWLQIGVGPLHEGEVFVRLHKPKEWNPEWWRFEPLYTAAVQSDAERDALEKALNDAATSLETLATLSGRETWGDTDIPTHMGTFMDVRLYAAARAKVAREAIAAMGTAGKEQRHE